MKFEGKRKGSRGSDPQRDKCLLEEFFTRERERSETKERNKGSQVFAAASDKIRERERFRKEATGEGSSAALEFDIHQFRSAEHQQRFKAIKGWSFHRESRV